MNAPSDKVNVLTLSPSDKGWVCVETPTGETQFVAAVSVAGVSVDLSLTGKMELHAERGGWAIEGDYSPTLLVEAPEWYSPPEEPHRLAGAEPRTQPEAENESIPRSVKDNESNR